MESNQPVEPKKSNSKAGFIIAFLSIIVIIQGVKIYLDFKDKA